jgi:hypothetical protein
MNAVCRRLTPVLAVALSMASLLSAVARVASADEIVLDTGERIDGEVVPYGSTEDAIVVRMRAGGTRQVKRDQIDAVVVRMPDGGTRHLVLRDEIAEWIGTAAKRTEEAARRQAEEKARRDAEEEKARRDAEEEKARRDTEEKARREAEEQARREAEEQARREAEEQARREAEEQARRSEATDKTPRPSERAQTLSGQTRASGSPTPPAAGWQTHFLAIVAGTTSVTIALVIASIVAISALLRRRETTRPRLHPTTCPECGRFCQARSANSPCPYCTKALPVAVESVPPDEEFTSDDDNGERTCPMCAELIKTKAKICKHCGSDVTKPASGRYRLGRAAGTAASRAFGYDSGVGTASAILMGLAFFVALCVSPILGAVVAVLAIMVMVAGIAARPRS